MSRKTDELALLTTESLLSQARKGSNSAWKAVLLRYKVTLMAAVGRHIGGCADVEDVVQEAFVKSVTSLESFQYTSEGCFRRYLLSIVINRCHDLLRVERAFVDVDLSELSESSGRENETVRAVELTSALNSLPEELREVVLLKKYEGKSWNEVCAVLEESESAARRKYTLAIGRLRNALS